MKIPQEQIEFKKAVGKSKGKTVYHMKTRGGLHLIAMESGEVLGTGSHKALARHIASRYEPDIDWSELSKSEHVDYRDFQQLIEKYDQFTQSLRKAQGL